MNKLLERQLKRFSISYDNLPDDFKKVLDAVNNSYEHYESDRMLIERSIELSSKELTDANKKLSTESSRQNIVINKLKSVITSLRQDDEDVFSPDVFKDDDLITIADVLTKQIQKRKEAEAKLILYERAINSSTNGILISDPNLPGNPTIFCNPAMLKMTGYTAEEFLGKTRTILQRDDTEQEGLNEIRKAIIARIPCSVVVRNYRKDGTMFWNDIKISPIFNAKGVLTHYIGIQTDVTSRIESERKLMEANSRISALIQNLQAGILVEDENRRIVVSNQEFCNMFAIPVPPENLLGYDCVLAIDQSKDLFENPNGFIKRISDILEDRKSVIGEELILADGRILERDYIPIFISQNHSGHLWQYRNITEKKLSEQKIIESEKLFRQIIDNAGEIIYRIEPDGIFTYVNPTAIRILGYNVDELIGKRYVDFVREDFIAKMILFYRKQLSENITSTYYEFPAVKKSGEIVWLGQNVQLVFGVNGITELQAVARDISERIIFEKEIQRLKSFYEQILNDLPGQVAVFDKNLNYLFLNPSSMSNSELREWMIGRNDLDYCESKGLDISLAHQRQDRLRTAISNHAPQQFEEVSTRDGELVYFTRVISPVFDNAGAVKYLIGYGLNITDLKMAQLKLTDSQRQLLAVLNTVGEGIVTIDNSDNIVMINEEISKIWGYTKEELLGRSLQVLLPSQLHEITSLWRTGEKVGGSIQLIGNRVELEGLRKDGTIFPIELKIQETKIEDKTYYTAAIRDITQSKKVLEELILSKKAAEESTKAKEQFLAHMSHEIRTPMNAVVALTQMLLDMNPNLEQQPFLDSIKASAENLLVIINDILDFSKIEAGKIEIQERDFSVRKLVNELQNTAKYISLEKSIKLEFTVDDNIPDSLIGDVVRLNQILLNLVSNAIKFTERGSVTFKCDKVSSSPDSVLLKFTITDSGIGIPKDKIDSIFNSFEQISSKGISTRQGTGLGLAIVKKLVDLHNGKITVKSFIGIGSEFIVEISLKIGTAVSDSKSEDVNLSPKKLDLTGIKVLIAEDNVMNQFVATKVLEKYGAHFMIANNGIEAIKTFTDYEFDIILMDMGMPEMDGYEATERIRQDFSKPKSEIPIIALTAFASLHEDGDKFSFGITDKLNKPYKPDELARKIISVLNRAKPHNKSELKDTEHNDSLVPQMIDESAIHDLMGDDKDLIREMIGMFLTNTPAFLVTMKDEINNDNYEKARETAHSMKPTFSYVGLTLIEPQFQKYFDMLKTNKNKEELLSLLNEIELLINSAYSELKKYLNNL